MAGIQEEELLQFLKSIEEGVVSLEPESIPQDIYAGNVSYKASNGWWIRIFNDCNQWDYVDQVVAADGRSVDFNEIDDCMPIAREYAPEDEVAWSRYGIPGYMRFRCGSCGVDIKGPELEKGGFLCVRCRLPGQP
jgi:hypothetical protein